MSWVDKILIILVLSALLVSFWYTNVQAPVTDTRNLLPIAKELPKITTIIAVGDILLSRHVGAKIDKANNPNLPFEHLQEILSKANIAFGNLECPLSLSNIPIREGLIFRCLIKYVPGLTFAGFDVLSTANNHALDQGVSNLEFTIDYLKSKSILPVGTKKSQDVTETFRFPSDGGLKASVTSTEPIAIIERNGTKWGFLAFSYTAHNDSGKSIHPNVTTMENLELLKSAVLNLKSQADVVIVSMHAGTEYTRKPNQQQIDFAHAAIDAGADLVIGHHPHWIQTVEIYKNRPIFYSLGNFVFDQMWSEETREGLMVQLEFRDKQLESAKLIPVIIENYCCPRLATGQEKTEILKKISLDSEIINLNFQSE